MEKELIINGIKYIPEPSNEGLKCVMVRTYSAGVFYGFLLKRESTLAGIEVTLKDARRVWYWDGAASLSQLAIEGTKKPENCKFPCKVNSIELIAIEIIEMTKIAYESLEKVKIWEM